MALAQPQGTQNQKFCCRWKLLHSRNWAKKTGKNPKNLEQDCCVFCCLLVKVSPWVKWNSLRRRFLKRFQLKGIIFHSVVVGDEKGTSSLGRKRVCYLVTLYWCGCRICSILKRFIFSLSQLSFFAVAASHCKCDWWNPGTNQGFFQLCTGTIPALCLENTYFLNFRSFTLGKSFPP